MFEELILLRHAKSAWPIGVRDSDRPLSARGIRDAKMFGAALKTSGRHIDTVLVSPAQRTRQTWSLVSAQVGLDEQAATFDDRLYAASWWDVIDVVRGLPSSTQTALLIGHNPSLEDLAGQLANGNSDAVAMKELRTKFPTCAAAFVTGELGWSKWGGQCAALTEFWTPRQHRNRP